MVKVLSELPPPPTDPGDLGGCSEQEANLRRLSAALASLANQIAQGTNDPNKGPEYYRGLLNGYNNLLQEFNAAQAAFNSIFPSCNPVSCGGGDNPQGVEAWRYPLPEIAPGSVEQAISSLQGCLAAIDAAIAANQAEIDKMKDCQNKINKAADGLGRDGRLPANSAPVLNPETGEVTWTAFDNFGRCAAWQAFTAAAVGLLGCVGTPIPDLGQTERFVGAADCVAKHAKMRMKWADGMTNFGGTLSRPIGNKEKENQVLRAEKEAIAKAIDALPNQVADTLKELANTVINIMDTAFVTEILGCHIGFQVWNMPSASNFVGWDASAEEFKSLATITNAKSNPPTCTVDMDKVKGLLNDKLSKIEGVVKPEADDPPGKDDQGVWARPLTAAASCKRYVPESQKPIIEDKLNQIRNTKIGAMKTRTCSFDGIPVQLGGIDLNGTIGGCSGCIGGANP